MKKALSVLLTAAMAASMMAGCGSSSDGAASGTTTDNGAAAGTESAGAAAADGAAFKIGGIGPTTGACIPSDLLHRGIHHPDTGRQHGVCSDILWMRRSGRTAWC